CLSAIFSKHLFPFGYVHFPKKFLFTTYCLFFCSSDAAVKSKCSSLLNAWPERHSLINRHGIARKFKKALIDCFVTACDCHRNLTGLIAASADEVCMDDLIRTSTVGCTIN